MIRYYLDLGNKYRYPRIVAACLLTEETKDEIFEWLEKGGASPVLEEDCISFTTFQGYTDRAYFKRATMKEDYVVLSGMERVGWSFHSEYINRFDYFFKEILGEYQIYEPYPLSIGSIVAHQ